MHVRNTSLLRQLTHEKLIKKYTWVLMAQGSPAAGGQPTRLEKSVKREGKATRSDERARLSSGLVISGIETLLATAIKEKRPETTFVLANLPKVSWALRLLISSVSHCLSNRGD